MQSGFVNMQDRLKFATGRLHFGRDITWYGAVVASDQFLQILGHR